MMNLFNKLTFSILFSLIFIFPASATVVTGSLISGTGNQSLIPNGDFESGLASWTQLNFGKGSFTTSTTAFAGTTSAKSVPYSGFIGPGFALQSTSVAVVADQKYILSGYINTANNTTSQTYIDLSDAFGFDINLGIGEIVNSVSDWQFIYGSFTPTTNSVRVRLVQDLSVTAGDTVLFDNIGITLASEFRAPIVQQSNGIPVPTTPLLFSLGLLCMGLLRKQSLVK